MQLEVQECAARIFRDRDTCRIRRFDNSTNREDSLLNHQTYADVPQRAYLMDLAKIGSEVTLEEGLVKKERVR